MLDEYLWLKYVYSWSHYLTVDTRNYLTVNTSVQLTGTSTNKSMK